MSLRWNLTHGSSDQRDVSARVRANSLSVRINAEEGSVAITTVNLDDPDGDLIVNGLAGLFGSESEVPGTIYDQTFIRGFIADRTVSRGDDDTSFRTTDARKWAVNIADQNSLLSRRILLGNDANRPAETDVERVQYLMGTPEMNLIDEEDYIDTSGPVAMDAADYRGQTAFDILNDCAQASGKNFWVMFRPDIGNSYGLWYDFTSSTAYSSDITISNDMADVDGVTCFAASFDSTMVRDPSRVYSGVYMPYDGGAVYRQLASTASNFHARDTTSYSPNVKTAAKANARADRYLASIATEEDRITTSIIVPNAQVQDLKEGHRVQAKFTHFPGYEAFTWMRVLNRTIEQVSEYFYQITVELSAEVVDDPVSACDVTPTASGFYGPLGDSGSPPYANVTPANGVIVYGRPGEGTPAYPPNNAAGWTTNVWHFPIYGAGGAGTMDQGAPDTLNYVYLYLFGEGTLTIHTTEITPLCTYSIYQTNGDGFTSTTLGSAIPIGGSHVVNVTAGNGAYSCWNRIELAFAGPSGKFGFNGVDWALNDVVIVGGGTGSGAGPVGGGAPTGSGGDEPTDGGSVLTLTAADSVAEFEAATENMGIDTIELASGNYTWQSVSINVDRSARPLTIRPALGATVNFVGPATSTGIIFLLGQVNRTKYVTFDGRAGGGGASAMFFKDMAIPQAGVFEPRGTDYCTFKYLTFQNISRDTGYSDQPYKTWCFYISAAGSGSNDHLLIDHCSFKAPASYRDVSAIQVASSGSHGNISITNVVEMQDYHYAFAADLVSISNLVLDTWTMDDCGRTTNNSSIRILSGSSVNGTYSNIVATSSEPFVNAGSGTMTNGGGNSGI